MYYVFVLFIGCYRANLQNIPLLHLSEAAVSPVWQRLFTKVRSIFTSVRTQILPDEDTDSFVPLAKILPNVSHVGFILNCRAKFLQNSVLQNYLHTSNQ